jgi:hypothetical protein
VIDETIVQPGEARVFRIPMGATFCINDVEGRQAAEMLVFDEDDPLEYIDCSVTMEVIGRLFPTEKSKFYTNRYEPMLTLLEDTVGSHDLIHPATSAQSRALFLGESGDRQGTLEWSRAALTEAGITTDPLPRPVHLFRSTTVDEDGNFAMMETPSNPGDGVRLQAERNLVVVITVPDDEISPICGCNPTPIKVTVEGVV